MKKRLNLIILILFFIMIISSCNNNNNENTTINIDNDLINYDDYIYDIPNSNNPNGIKIIYDLNNGFKFESTTTVENKILKPENNPKKVASTFLGWYEDIELNNEYDFNKIINKETTIYAKYETDTILLNNYINYHTTYSSILIKSIFSNDNDNSYFESSGSGVILSFDGSNYYCLTNNHVIYRHNEYKNSNYYIYDYNNNEFEGHILYNDNKYDLALLYFDKKDNYGSIHDNLGTIKFSKYMPNINDKLITISNPKKNKNQIDYGSYLELKNFTPDISNLDKSNIEFKVMAHSCYLDDGSSGSMLLDDNLYLVGINFATQVNNAGEYEYSYAIPYYKIIEFVNDYMKNKLSD